MNPLNGHYGPSTKSLNERPAIKALIGDPIGLRILDVGCGAGSLAEYLLTHGAASITGVDGGSKMADIAWQRLADHISRGSLNIHTGDLNNPLPLPALDLGTFHMVVSSLAFRDWTTVISECKRCLRPGEVLVVSAHHPMMDLINSRPNPAF
jgi:SAM-dependent methyltransferase